tara:strand:+ start:891 stop:1115 length:225 start_codon:yes stop_codon:yes gene_type:complete
MHKECLGVIDMTTAACDKYGFKTLAVGDQKIVMGVAPKHAQMMYYRYCVRKPELIDREFEWVGIYCGVIVRRIK